MKESKDKITNFLKERTELTQEKLFSTYQTSLQGLSQANIENKLDEYGYNIISSGKKESILFKFITAFINPLNLILFAVAVTTFFTDVVFSDTPSYLSVIIILSIILISSLIGFFQEQKSNNSAEKLKKMIVNKATVIRDNSEKEISIEEVVPGDVVKLSSGDILPGDVIFLTTKDLFISQSTLTGESSPVEKFNYKNNLEETLTDISNLGFMGTNVVSGNAKALILSTGNNTYFGNMVKDLSGKTSKNSFEKGIASISKLLIRLMIVVLPAVFLINGVIKGNWLESIIFAVTMAVGLTPEMLPMIMTSALANGSVKMSRKKTIVKNLSSIQAFGEMDILCTDKTGTLTENKITIEKYIDIFENESEKILKHAFLNSYFHTGQKNVIDLAIVAREEARPLIEQYKCVDEIPFDFNRRRLSVVVEDLNNKRQLITKGAVDEIISICSYVEIDGVAQDFTDEMKAQAKLTYEKYNNDGLMVLAIAQKNNIRGINEFNVEDEKEMVLMGFVGLLDPPKESAAKAISALKKHGVKVVVLTGDSAGVATHICNNIGIDTTHILSGKDIENLSDEELKPQIESCNLFVKLSPIQKERVVKMLQANGHTLGYIGDGINDAPPLKQSDVGISVENAVDIAKETADIILLEKDLMVLKDGIIEGRKTFSNILKYIKMTISSDFGNIFSVLIASVFLPFLPLLPIHILLQSLLSDFSQTGIAFDNVDEEYLEKPRKWNTREIRNFILIMGPLSSIFDVLCFILLWFVLGANSIDKASLFQNGWFIFGALSQILIVYLIRTNKKKILKSNPSKLFILSTGVISLLAIFISFTPIAVIFKFTVIPISFAFWYVILFVGYWLTIKFAKKRYIAHFGSWM
ncbi:MAG: magnesium-translocating P-type ATPase [Oscillospiraceae bacterium]|nr:magnesium-translocating P-type ATPase [Oscillospiraceae bacterium]